MMSKMEEIFKKVLNDRDIYNSPYDKDKGETIPKLFEKESWKELGRLFSEDKRDEFISKIDSRISEIENQERQAKYWRKGRIKKLIQLGKELKLAFEKKPYLLKQLFENLEWYGLVECKLPNMDSYGKVIERYGITTVEQYFLDKISRLKSPKNKALEKVLEYVKELYIAGISIEEISYFVRKLNSLTKYWEVIECMKK